MTSVLAAPGLSQRQVMEVGHHGHHIRHAHRAGSQQPQQQQQQQLSAYNGNGTGTASLQTDLLSPHRPTSAPPDLELNSSSVFSFGLDSYSFRKESACQQPTIPPSLRLSLAADLSAVLVCLSCVQSGQRCE